MTIRLHTVGCRELREGELEATVRWLHEYGDEAWTQYQAMLASQNYVTFSPEIAGLAKQLFVDGLASGVLQMIQTGEDEANREAVESDWPSPEFESDEGVLDRSVLEWFGLEPGDDSEP